MRYSLIILCSALCIAPALSAADPSADDILKEARAAMGGTKLDGLKSLILSGVQQRSMGNDMTMSSDVDLTLALPGKILRETQMQLPTGDGGPTIVECLNEGEFWNDTRSAGPGMMVRIGGGPGGPEAQKRSFSAGMARYLLAMTLSTQSGFPVTFKYAGEAEAPDGKAFALDGTGPDDFAVRLFIDEKSHLPVMMSYKTVLPVMRVMGRGPQGGPQGGPPPDMSKMGLPAPPPVDAEMHISGFKDEGGVRLPHLFVIAVAGNTNEQLEIRKVRVNAKIDDGKFKK